MSEFDARAAAERLSKQMPSGNAILVIDPRAQYAAPVKDEEGSDSLEDVMELLKGMNYTPGGPRGPRESTNVEDRRNDLFDRAVSYVLANIGGRSDEAEEER